MNARLRVACAGRHGGHDRRVSFRMVSRSAQESAEQHFKSSKLVQEEDGLQAGVVDLLGAKRQLLSILNT
eukprot:178997-Pleurochrysis_carterae.AAC.2